LPANEHFKFGYPERVLGRLDFSALLFFELFVKIFPFSRKVAKKLMHEG
jgi:hypothetical protein